MPQSIKIFRQNIHIQESETHTKYKTLLAEIKRISQIPD